MTASIEEIKLQNIIEMAISFTTMTRVFEKGTKKKIASKLYDNLPSYFALDSHEQYCKKHIEFCTWFMDNVRIAERKRDGRIIKKTQAASWGHGAKVLDIVLKVCFYYCGLPTKAKSDKIIPWLNGAVDTPIIKDLCSRYPEGLDICKIEDIDRQKYEVLQQLIRKDIRKFYDNGIYPVHYDDIKWRTFNR